MDKMGARADSGYSPMVRNVRHLYVDAPSWLVAAHQRFRDVAAGRPSSGHPALERSDPGLFGINVAAVVTRT